jgi:transposase
MKRKEAIDAVRSGAAITATAARFGISRVTLHRWLRAFDPGHPIASARPDKTGPKGPRWDDATVTAVVTIIEAHPDLWGSTRVTAALADRGIVLSEKTVRKIIQAALDRLARERRAAQARRSRQIAVIIRREEREAVLREMVVKQLHEIFAPGVTVEDAVSKLVAAFTAKRWKFETKDLTPELREFADAYLRAVPFMAKYFTEDDGWLLEVRHWHKQDHARVAAINHFVKRSKAADPQAARPMEGRKEATARRPVTAGTLRVEGNGLGEHSAGQAD